MKSIYSVSCRTCLISNGFFDLFYKIDLISGGVAFETTKPIPVKGLYVIYLCGQRWKCPTTSFSYCQYTFKMGTAVRGRRWPHGCVTVHNQWVATICSGNYFIFTRHKLIATAETDSGIYILTLILYIHHSVSAFLKIEQTDMCLQLWK